MRYYVEDFLETNDGAELWYALLGDARPTLVTCDGLGCDGFAWRRLGRRLTDQFQVLRWNYRGHGRSGLGRDPARLSIQVFAEDLAAVLDAAHVERAVVLGHSMGVQVALEFHRLFGDRVLGLVPICGAPGNVLDAVHDDDTFKRYFPFLRRATERFPGLTRALTRTIIPTEVALQYALQVEVNRSLVRREDFLPYFTHLGRMDPLVFVRTLESAAVHSAVDHLPQVDVPTLIVAADRDRFTPLRLSRAMHEAIPDSELLVVPGGSHTAVIEKPDLIAARIERFLRERVLGAR